MGCGKHIAKWVWVTATIKEQILELFLQILLEGGRGGGGGGSYTINGMSKVWPPKFLFGPPPSLFSAPPLPSFWNLLFILLGV